MAMQAWNSTDELEVRMNFLENQIQTLESVQEKHPNINLEQQIRKYRGELLEVWEKIAAILEEEEATKEYYDTYNESWTLCPSCGSDGLYHEDCGKKVRDCICYENEELDTYCFNCDASQRINVGMVYDDTITELIADIASTSKTTSVVSSTSTYTPQSSTLHSNVKSCSHAMERVVLNEEKELYVYCSGSRHVFKTDVIKGIVPSPDFGLYADGSWDGLIRSRNEFINWPDFNVPLFPDDAVNQMIEAFTKYIVSGEHRLEIGCIGGHGRTGTILACFYMFANPGMKPSKAIELTRKNYCPHAIETYDQAEFVFALAEEMLSIVDDTDPAVYADHWSTGGSFCTELSHHQMMANGADKCIVKDNCGFWRQDLKSYKEQNGEGPSSENKQVETKWQKSQTGQTAAPASGVK